jgi:[acyl-carrier-protein] S-malonyltransferase
MGVTLLFPGQGAQYVGMGKNLMDFSESKTVFDKADSALDFKISELCFEGPVEQLVLTENTQPAIVTHSIALFEKLKTILDEKNISITRVLGHSVGEYSALVAAGSISLEDAVRSVKNRGKFMQDATPSGVGKMFAVMRVPSEIVAKACAVSSTEDNKVMAANFNEPTQTVISGHAEACARAVEWITENFEGRSRAIELKVSAPFHSSLMKPAEHKLNTFFDSISIKDNEIPYVANVNTQEYPIGTNGDVIRENLVNQVCGSVLWAQSIAKLDENEIFIEVGPGKVLTGLNKKINKEFKTYTLDSDKGFEGLVEFLNECTK